MSLKVEGQTCPVCHAYLFDDDDIVYCPVCGAPHHRDCYNSVGHCGLESLHGTEQQYDRKKFSENAENGNTANGKNDKENTIVCPNCLKKLEEDTPVCPYCGRPRNGVFIDPKILFGTNEISDIEGVRAQTVAEFVGINAQRYLPKFIRLNEKKKVSWNWMAFLFPEGWFFLRKMYKTGALILTIIVAAQICSIPLLSVFSGVVSNNMNAQMSEIYEAFSKAGTVPVALAAITGAVMLIVRIISALFGDYWYKKHIIPKARQAESPAEDKMALIGKYGGVNLILFVLGVVAAMYIPDIIATFLI